MTSSSHLNPVRTRVDPYPECTCVSAVSSQTFLCELSEAGGQQVPGSIPAQGQVTNPSMDPGTEHFRVGITSSWLRLIQAQVWAPVSGPGPVGSPVMGPHIGVSIALRRSHVTDTGTVSFGCCVPKDLVRRGSVLLNVNCWSCWFT